MYMYNGSYSLYANVAFHNKKCFDRGYISFVYSWQHRYEWGWKINVELPKYVIVAEKNIFYKDTLLKKNTDHFGVHTVVTNIVNMNLSWKIIIVNMFNFCWINRILKWTPNLYKRSSPLHLKREKGLIVNPKGYT